MNITPFTYREDRELPLNQLIALYRANGWSSANMGETLRSALLASHSLITAWSNDQLIGLGNAISDGYLVVYYPHLVFCLSSSEGELAPKSCGDMLRYRFTSTCWSLTDARSIFTASADLNAAMEKLSGGKMWLSRGHDH